MTPTGLVSTPAPSLPSNWYELAIKARTAALRDSQRNMSAPASIPSDTASEAQVDTTSRDQDAAAPQPAAIQCADAPIDVPESTPEVKMEPIVEPLLQPDTLRQPTAEASLSNQPLAGGLVGESSSAAPESAAPAAVASTSSVTQPIISALANTSASRSPPSEGADALRTEIMGPPPSLPADPAYPPLNPVISDAPVIAPTNHKRKGTTGVNGTQRKSSALQAPVDYVAPTNINGKMPYALFQTIKRTSPVSGKASTETAVGAERSHSESTPSDAGIVSKDCGVSSEVTATAESSAVDPPVADVLTDADSVATATATRETSPDAATATATVPLSATATEVGAIETGTSQSPATNDAAASLPVPVVSESLDSIPAASMLSAVEAGDSTLTSMTGMRRNPSNRGASLLASQSITSAYADPLGLKKHRELQLQEEARARRSPSASSAGTGPAQNASTSAVPKKSTGAARTIVPPPLVEPPPGMMHMADGKLRTIPGIAGAIIPPGPSSTSTDTNLSPRLEDKGSVNNDFCETCGGHGRFVCCDGCPRSFHFHCMSPPLDIDEMPASNAAEVLGPAKSGLVQKAKSKAGTPGPSSEINTDEMWFCNVCVAERKPKAVQKPKGLGPFGQLLPLLSLQNPKSFQLPADVRTYFKDVATANDGDYVNAGMLRQVKPNKHGLIEARDPYRLKDKNGDVVLCYRCGGTALPAESTADPQHVAASTPAEHTVREGTGWRKIVSCDFCPLHWHIDCVDPLMLGMPSNLRRWMCPAHSDHVNDRRRIARVGASVPKTLDLPIPSAKTIGPGKHFRTRVLNNGDIDIIPDPMELLMGGNGITGSLQSGVKDVPVVPGVVDSPALTAGGSKLASKIRFRFPEKVIRTDFWSKVRGDQASKIGDVFYVAAEEAGLVPTRLIALEDGVTPGDELRYRPFGKRDYALSGLDALADIASSRLKTEDLPLNTGAFVQPSRTRHLIHTALGINLSSDDIPESSIRASLTDLDSSESPLSSLSDSDEPAPTPLAPSTTTALSEEEQIKRLTAAAASAVSSGEPPRLSKRKAAVAAESAISGSPAKKARSASPTPVPVAVEVRPTGGGKKITLKPTLSESQVALRTAHHLAGQHAEERREMEQLRAVRELMRVKGVARLMEFLLSPNDDDDEKM
ncbi:Zinc finger, PHD-finger [Kalmanozyma brasiliensis GHG001]|nr:Zinc finger, PHD-finger [Kalmanozyma brasiliensis GHG001]EST07480.2 Zinc finger, PHD-finger [Kalmanozyma brasiliensis GHG001]